MYLGRGVSFVESRVSSSLFSEVRVPVRDPRSKMFVNGIDYRKGKVLRCRRVLATDTTPSAVGVLAGPVSDRGPQVAVSVPLP